MSQYVHLYLDQCVPVHVYAHMCLRVSRSPKAGHNKAGRSDFIEISDSNPIRGKCRKCRKSLSPPGKQGSEEISQSKKAENAENAENAATKMRKMRMTQNVTTLSFFSLMFLFPWCFSCWDCPWSFCAFSAYFPGFSRVRKVRKILGVFEVFLGIFEKTKEKKDRVVLGDPQCLHARAHHMQWHAPWTCGTSGHQHWQLRSRAVRSSVHHPKNLFGLILSSKGYFKISGYLK